MAMLMSSVLCRLPSHSKLQVVRTWAQTCLRVSILSARGIFMQRCAFFLEMICQTLIRYPFQSKAPSGRDTHGARQSDVGFARRLWLTTIAWACGALGAGHSIGAHMAQLPAMATQSFKSSLPRPARLANNQIIVKPSLQCA